MRDVICNEIPMVLRKEVYVSAVAAGCAVYLCLVSGLDLSTCIGQAAGFITTVVIRLLAVHHAWDLDPKVVEDTQRKVNRGNSKQRKRWMK